MIAANAGGTSERLPIRITRMRIVSVALLWVKLRPARLVLLLVLITGGSTGCINPSTTTPALEHGLVQVRDFEPGNSRLRMYRYIPPTARASAPMVVVLHHCFQNALDYFLDAGWDRVAEKYGLVLLIPEESPQNSPFLCFDFAARHERGKGEADTIRRMVERMTTDYSIDQRRIFITGMSAGGSMAIVMMALYPELFAGGGVIGSVPFGCPDLALGMLSCIQTESDAPSDFSPQSLEQRVRSVTLHEGLWPRLSVWAGSLDWVIKPINSTYIVRQWTALHGIAGPPTEVSEGGGLRREVYRNVSGEVVVESITIADIGHSVPIDYRHGCGDDRRSELFVLVSDVGVCSSEEMVRFWGLPVVSQMTKAH